MKITKTKEVKTPLVSDDGSSGYDFFIPTFNSTFGYHFDELNKSDSVFLNEQFNCIEIYPQGIVKIPTGVKIKMKRLSFLSKLFKSFTGLKLVPKFQAYDK